MLQKFLVLQKEKKKGIVTLFVFHTQVDIYSFWPKLLAYLTKTREISR